MPSEIKPMFRYKEASCTVQRLPSDSPQTVSYIVRDVIECLLPNTRSESTQSSDSRST